MKHAIFIILLIFVASAPAAELLVPSQYPNIQAAINDANDGDTVLVAAGTYTGTGNRDIDFLGKAITVRSENGPETCIIECNYTGSGFLFENNEDINSVLEGFTITDCFGEIGRGGGICCLGGRAGNASPSIFDCIIIANAGGIYCERSSPKITGCTITNNISESFGGGGIHCEYNSNPTIADCTITSNFSCHDGGGIHCEYNSNPTIADCTITNNLASYYNDGGGIYCSESSPTITGCAITGNSAEYGGGIHCEDSNSTIANCIISDNKARGRMGGAGICLLDSLCLVHNSTITGNAANFGGGIRCSDGSGIAITNSILWNNVALELGPQISLDGASTASISYTDLQGGQDDVYIWSGTLNWLAGNLDIDPCFVEPGYWGDVNDHNIILEPNDPNAVWVEGDYHLKSSGWRWDTARQRWDWDDVTSRCIDAGNPGSPLADEPLSIPEDPNNVWGENLRINMGAYGGTVEASIPPYDWAILADLTNDGTVDLIDFAYQAADWLNSAAEQPGDFNRDDLIDTSDLALLADDWLKQTSWNQ